MGILLVYDVTDEASFNNIRNWMRNIEQHASDNVNKVGAADFALVTTVHRLAQWLASLPLLCVMAGVAFSQVAHGCALCAGPCGE